MISKLVDDKQIKELTEEQKILFAYSKLEYTKELDIKTKQDEQEFLQDLQNDEQFKKDMKNYCLRLLEDMRQKYESLKKLLEDLNYEK